jgi:protein-S-isoprenylcysteine O-methyltransferase Ste14
MVYVVAAAACLFGLGGIAFWLARRDMAARGTVATITFGLMFLGFAGSGVAVVAAARAQSVPLPISSISARVSGVFVGIAGLAICLAARLMFTFRRAWGLDFDLLITRGIYRWSRNPQVLGWFLMYCGIGLFHRSGAALVIAVLFLVAFVPWILAEERALQRRFGAPYEKYRAQTPRFFIA